jgi:peptidoglycan L-alanyl-D-glutamate endopeptidase CwlK
MPSFGKLSLARLATADERLSLLMQEAIRTSPVDFTVVCGHRSKEDQDRACAEGKSKAPFPTSKHNCFPSRAVDVCPFREGVGLVWGDKALFRQMAAHIMVTAKRLGLPIRWGGDFNRDGDKTTNDAWDMPHFEIVE